MFDYFADIDWTQTWSTVLIGMGVVFAVLIILVLFCWAMGKIFSSVGGNGGNKTEKKSETKAAPKAAPAAAPIVEDGITDEVVAAISAAIACMMGEGKAFAVKSIRRAEGRAVRGTRNAWSAAGIAENTRPF